MYCRRAWWYRRQGVESENQAELASGTGLHLRHGRSVLTASLLQIAGFLLLLAAVALLVASLTTSLLR